MRSVGALAAVFLLAMHTPASQERVAILYPHQNYGGDPFVTSVNTARLPNGVRGDVSSLKIRNAERGWTILWESENFDDGDDQLWIEGPREITWLNFPRQHGGSWNDVIKAISFSDTGPPWDDSDNRSICLVKGPCAQRAVRRIPSNPVLTRPNPEHPGWFVRVCPGRSDPELRQIRIFLANHNPRDEDKFLWHTWTRGDPTTINLPMNFRYIRDLWLRGEGVPDGKRASMCVGYHDHITWEYQFEHGEDHQPDQNDRRNCEC